MKYYLLIGLVVLSGCITAQQCKDIALDEAKEWQDLGRIQGIDRGMEICEDNYKPMLEQYIPSEDCVILVKNRYLIQYICEGDEYYEVLK